SPATCPPQPHPLSLYDALPISAAPDDRNTAWLQSRSTADAPAGTCQVRRLFQPAFPVRAGIARVIKETRPKPQKTMDPHACPPVDRKSTRLNSSHVAISYAVFC